MIQPDEFDRIDSTVLDKLNGGDSTVRQNKAIRRLGSILQLK
jgi:hypothetical protein